MTAIADVGSLSYRYALLLPYDCCCAVVMLYYVQRGHEGNALKTPGCGHQRLTME